MNICQKHFLKTLKIKIKKLPHKRDIFKPNTSIQFFCWMLCQLTSHPPAPIAGISKRYRRLPMPFHRTRVVSASLLCQFRFSVEKTNVETLWRCFYFGCFSFLFGTFVCFLKIMMTLAVETPAFLLSEE